MPDICAASIATQALTTKCHCLIRLNKVEQGLALAQAHSLEYEKAYCLYRLKRNDEAVAAVDGSDGSVAMKILRSQLLYRIGCYEDAATVLDELVQVVKDDPEIYVNWVAAHTAACTRLNEALLKKAMVYSDAEASSLFELEHNVGCGYIALGEFADAEKHLAHCAQVARDVLAEDEYADEEIDAEVASIEIVRAFVVAKQGRKEEAEKLYVKALQDKPSDDTARVIAANNLMVLRETRDLFDSYKRVRSSMQETTVAKLPPDQQKTLQYNKALLLLHMRKKDECRNALKNLREQYPDSALPDRIEAALLQSEKKLTKCVDFLQAKAAAQEVKNPETALEYSLTLAQIYISLSKFDSALEVLFALGDQKYTPQLASTIVDLYERVGDIDKAVEFFSSALEQSMNAGEEERSIKLLMQSGEFLSRHGKYELATKQYERLLGGQFQNIESETRLQALSLLVVASSHFDPDTAEEKSSALPLPQDVESLDAEALENELLNRQVVVKPSNESKDAISDQAAEIAAKKLATRKRKIAKVRQKRREAYIKRLKEKHGEDVDLSTRMPDPDRWIPKRFRKGGRQFKQRRGQKLTGGQGAGNIVTKKSAALDAREAAIKREEERKKKEEERAAYNEANRKKNAGRRKKKGRR